MKLQTEVAPIRFGSPRSLAFDEGSPLELALPTLAGNPVSHLPVKAGDYSRRGAWRIWESDSLICAQGFARVSGSPADATGRLYQEAFAIAGDRHLYRFWNFIPQLNQKTDGVENYRLFGMGRHGAFVERFGPERANERMPAATGVGIDDDALVVIMVAGKEPPQHLENPNQIPAYRYPDQYGPRPPSFARATRVESGGSRYFFLSGTSSVLGHASTGVGNLARQTEVTLQNVETMAGLMGLSSRLGRGSGLRRMLRIYLRRSADLDAVRPLVEDRLVESGDDVVWLRSDICRADLDIEIEATLVDLRET